MVILSMLLILPVWLFITAMSFILPWLGMALTTVAAILLACNALFLLLLLFIRAWWKKSGRMKREYIDSLDGWKRYALLAARVLLIVAVVWEAIVVAVCAGLLVFRPWDAVLP